MKTVFNKYKEFLVALLIIIIILIIYGIRIAISSNVNNESIFNQKEENIKENDIIDGVKNNCKYKAFTVSFNNGFDLVKDMEYENKIYHKVITEYEDYYQFKQNGNDLAKMTLGEFDDYFMVITAIENVSMQGLTVDNIYKDGIALYIELNSFPEGTEYDKTKNGISIVIPKDMEMDKIKIIDGRQKISREQKLFEQKKEEQRKIEEQYGWKNTSIEGLKEIDVEQAIDIAKNYAKQTSRTNSRCSYLIDYTKVYQITKVSTKPNNYWTITDGIIESQIKYASFMRNAYEVTLVSEKDEMEIERAIFCVDSYTGKVIAGREMAD